MRQSDHPNKPVLDAVVPHGLCIGCGTCAGVCPAGCLAMGFTPAGEYQPHIVGECLGCGQCLRVCPFYDSPPNEDAAAAVRFGGEPGVHHDKAVGFYRTCYVGTVASEAQRWSRSSGGLASWFLAELLLTGRVDHVACVVPGDDPARRFKFALVESPRAIWEAAKSCYYPVEMSDVFRTVREQPGRYAIIGLPCFLKGVQKARANDRVLAERMTALIGLTCGHLKSGLFLEYLIRLAGFAAAEVEAVSFREKLQDVPASEYVFRCTARTANGPVRRLVASGEGYGHAWGRGYFKLNACNWCDDVFAEVADVSFMDAWLPPYNQDPRGTSLVVARAAWTEALLEEGRRRGELRLDTIPVERVAASQTEVVREKRERLAVRLALARRRGEWGATKRVAPARRVGRLARFWENYALRRMAASKEAMASQMAAGPGLDLFNELMRRRLRRKRLVEKALVGLSRAKRLPARLLRLLRTGR